MRALYYNCNSGISGDMNVAAMLDLGLPLDYLEGELAKLNLSGYKLDVSIRIKNGITGTQLKVICEGEDSHSHDHSGEDSHAHTHSHSLKDNDGSHSHSDEESFDGDSAAEHNHSNGNNIDSFSEEESQSFAIKLDNVNLEYDYTLESLMKRTLEDEEYIRSSKEKNRRQFNKLQRKYYIHKYYAHRHHLYNYYQKNAYIKKIAAKSKPIKLKNHRHHFHRKFSDIREIIEKSTLSAKVKEISLDIFENIAIAEAIVHSKDVEEVGFHEVGALDSIIDIVASAIALDYFNVDKIYSSKVELGGGVVKCAHGTLPVPAPATAILAMHFPCSLNAASFECTTPTGAGIIATTVDSFQEKFSGKIEAIGVGVGHKNSKSITNILRITLIDLDSSVDKDVATDEIVELSTNIDDMTPEQLAFLSESLFKEGALDVWQEPIAMKKNRLATKLSAICHLDSEAKCLNAFFKHSLTYGIRREFKTRYILQRQELNKETSLGKIRQKISLNEKFERSKVDFEDRKKIAEKEGISIFEVDQRLNKEL